jgi:hypothetical protein
MFLGQKCLVSLDKRSKEQPTFISKMFVIPEANPKFVPSASQFLLNKKSGFGITEVALNLEDDEDAVTRKIEMYQHARDVVNFLKNYFHLFRTIPLLNKVRFRMYVRGNAKSLEQCDKHVLNGLELFEFKRRMIYLAPIHDLRSENEQHRKWPPVTDPPKNETSVKDVPFHSRAIFERLGTVSTPTRLKT